MKKVGIITLNGYSNYGNRLQNYALQEVINKMGYDCETIINKTGPRLTKKQKIDIFLSKTSREKYLFLYNKINRVNKVNKIKSNNNITDDLRNKRTEVFKEFSNKYIKETNFEIRIDSIPEKLHEEYEYFITGSDQIWNPNDAKVSGINFLNFAPRYKRISYAPSFGTYEIPKYRRNEYRKWLSEMSHISVREDAGANIVKKLTGRDAEVVIDPTMLLKKEEWISIAKESKSKPSNKYLLTYFLGGVPESYLSTINRIASKYTLEVVNLADIKDIDHYITGPSEFIDYINSSSIFFTDSFHGCVFAILLETPFVLCNRTGQTVSTSMASRMDTLLNKFRLESRKLDNVDEDNILACDYTQANIILEDERQKALNYLNNALNHNR